MPKVYVDVSIFTEAKAFGMISGCIDVPAIPQVGDLMIFRPRSPPSVFAAIGQLRVNSRLIKADDDDPVILMLDDITVATDDDARAVMCFLEEGYGLSGDIWQVDD